MAAYNAAVSAKAAPVSGKLQSILDGFQSSADWGGLAERTRKDYVGLIKVIEKRLTGVTFNDLRGTAVTRLAKVEASVPQIATITGHSMRDVSAILDAHYLNRH